MADIIYTFEGSPYFNITNKCPCSCVFCVRDKKDVVGEAKKCGMISSPNLRMLRRQ